MILKPNVSSQDKETTIVKKKPFLKELWELRVLYLFLLPALAFVLIFNYRPMYGIVMAFQHYDIINGIGGSKFIGLDNFKQFLGSPDFFKACKNTAVIGGLTILAFPVPIIFAILVNEYGFIKLKKIVQSVTYLPYFISWVIVAGLLYKILDQDTGIINKMIIFFGMESIGFFREPEFFWLIYIIALVWKTMGWNSILYLSAMTSINPEIYEVATVDGASRFKRILHVTIPGIAPAIVVLFIMGLAGFFTANGAFEAIMAIRNPMVASSSDIIDVYSYFSGIRMADYGYATAIGATQSLLSLIVLFISNKVMKKTTGYSMF